MDERRQIRALFRAFLARFFENEISDGSRDLRNSFMWIVVVLAVPGLMIPFWNIFRWQMLLAFEGYDTFRLELLWDKAIYLSLATGSIMLLTAVVWQALLVDRRDAIVIGSFPVRRRIVVVSRLAALIAYVGIVGGGMHVIAAFAYSFILATSFRELVMGIVAHFVAGTLASMFACLSVAAFQATLLAIGGPRLFARVTAPAQAALAAAGLLLFLLSPITGSAVIEAVRGHAGSLWVLWLPPTWFLGLYEVILGNAHAQMAPMAARALAALGVSLAVLVVMYPLAYRRVAAAATFGSPLGHRRPVLTRLVARLIRLLPAAADVRGGLHFIALTAARSPRQKLVLASALGAAAALSLPFVLAWAQLAQIPRVPSLSQIAIPIAFVLFLLAGLRVAFSLPAELPASWVFTTSSGPRRTGVRAARAANAIVTLAISGLAAAVYAWFWDAGVALQLVIAIAGIGLFIGEVLLGGLEYVPFAQAYHPGRARLQSRWPIYLIATNVMLELVPYAILQLLDIGYAWLAGVTFAVMAAGVAAWRARQPQAPDLVDEEREASETLALRLY